MKMLCFGVDISDNDISCSDELILDVQRSLDRIYSSGAGIVRLTNITGDDIVLTAVVDDDNDVSRVNKAIYDVLYECARGFDDLNGVSSDESSAGEGISYVEVELDPDFLPDAVIVSFDTYCGESFVGKVAYDAMRAARGLDYVGCVESSVVDGVRQIPGLGFVSSETDDPVVVASVLNVEYVGVVAGAMIGAILGNKNTYLVRRGTSADVIPGSVIFTVTALMNGNVIDLSEHFSYRFRLLKG